jgi:dTDP-4-dehydrorhamnose reductase
VVQTIGRIAEGQHAGVFQLSADADISFAEAARYLSEQLAVDPHLVQPVNAGQSRLFDEIIAPYTSLDCTTARERLQIEPPAVWAAMDWALRPLLP